MYRKPTYNELGQMIKKLKNNSGDHKESEEELSRIDELFKAIFNNSGVGITISDEDMKLIMVNDRMARMFGMTKEELLKTPLQDIMPPEDIKSSNKRLESFYKGEIDYYRIEKRFIRKDGSIFWVDLSISPIRDKDGNIVASIGMNVDITDQKKSEEALRESEEKYRMMFEHAGLGIVLVDALTGERVEFNRELYERLGYTRDEYKQIKIKSVTDGRANISYLDHCKRIVENGPELFELQQRTKRGEILDILSSAVPIKIHGKNFIHLINIDITERKRMEENLKESEARYKSLFHDNLLVIYIIDPDTQCIIDVNNPTCSFYGYSREEMIGMNLKEISQLSSATIQERIKKTLIEGKNHFITCHHLANNENRDVEVYNTLIPIAGKKHIYTIVHDVTERKKEEEQIKIQAQILEEMSEGIILSNDVDNIFYTNRAMNVMSGYERGELIGKRTSILYPTDPEGGKKLFDHVDSCLKRQGNWMGELERVRKDGTSYKARVHITNIEIEGRTHWITVQEDITWSKQIKEQLEQARKMESIGNLAGGIAHDLNNILSPIMIYSEMTMMDLSPDSPLQHNLKEIFKAGERARDLVRQILTFARRQEKERIPIKISRILTESMQLLRSTLPTTIREVLDKK